jgi:hypothetical protein
MNDKDIISQVNAILKDHVTTPRSIFTFYKKDKKWHLEYFKNGVLTKSEHSSRVKAINSFFSRQEAGLNKFYIFTERDL